MQKLLKLYMGLPKEMKALLAMAGLGAPLGIIYAVQHWIFPGTPLFIIILGVIAVVAVIFVTTVTHYSFPGLYPWLLEFPTEPPIRLTSIGWVEAFFEGAVTHGEAFFDSITYGIRLVLDWEATRS